MTNISDLVQIGESLLDTSKAPDWLAAIVEIAKHRKDITAAVRDLAKGEDISTLDGLLAFLRGKLDKAEYIAAFAGVKLDALRELLATVEDEIAQLPTPVQKLIRPFSEFKEAAHDWPVAEPDTGSEPVKRPPAYLNEWFDSTGDDGEIALPLSIFDTKAAGTQGKLSFTFDAKADAVLSVEAGAVWPYARDEVSGHFLEIALNGEVTAKAGGSLPFQYGAIKASVGGGVNAQAMLYFQPENADALYAQVLAQSIAAMPNPFDLESVWAAMDFDGMAGQIFAIDGFATADLDIGIGKMADIPNWLSAEAGLSVKVGFKRAARYVVSARRIKTGAGLAIAVAVSHNKAQTTSMGLSAKLKLDLSPAFGQVRTHLETVVDQWDKHLGDLRPYLSPGTWIRGHASKQLGRWAEDLIKDSALRDAVVQDLGLLLGEDTDGTALRDHLVAQITEKLNAIAKMGSDPANALAQKAIEAVVDWLPSLAQDGARTKLQAELEKAIAIYQDTLTAKIDELAGKADDLALAKSLKDALQKLGAKVDGKLKALDERTAALRAFIDRMDALLHKILDFVKDQAKQQIAVEVSLSSSHTQGTDLDIAGTITNDSKQACLLWNAMMTGQWRSLQKLFDAPDSVSGFELNAQKSRLAEYSKRERRAAFTFVGLGVELSASQLLSAEATVTRDGDGNVVVATQSSLVKEKNGLRESRSIGFFSTYGLTLARLMAEDGGRSLSMNMAASHKDRSLKAPEVRGFFESLSARKLVSATRVGSALETYSRWTGTGGGNAAHPIADIDVRFILPKDDFVGLLALGRAVQTELTSGQDKLPQTGALFSAAYDAIMASGTVDMGDYAKEVAAARKAANPHGRPDDRTDKQWVIAVLLGQRRIVGPPSDLHFSKIRRAFGGGGGVTLGKLFDVVRMLNALANMLHLMAAIYDANPRTPTLPQGWTAKDYSKHQEWMTAAAGEWLDLNSHWFFWFKDGIGPRAVQFLALLVAFGRGIAPSAISPALSDSYFTITMTQRDNTGTALAEVGI